MDNSNAIQLTSTLLPNKQGNGFTGYFMEFPEVVVQGESETIVEKKLFEALSIMLDVYREISTKELYEKAKSENTGEKIERTHVLKAVA